MFFRSAKNQETKKKKIEKKYFFFGGLAQGRAEGEKEFADAGEGGKKNSNEKKKSYALINYGIQFSLCDENRNNNMILQTKSCSSILGTFKQLFPSKVHGRLCVVRSPVRNDYSSSYRFFFFFSRPPTTLSKKKCFFSPSPSQVLVLPCTSSLSSPSPTPRVLSLSPRPRIFSPLLFLLSLWGRKKS